MDPSTVPDLGTLRNSLQALRNATGDSPGPPILEEWSELVDLARCRRSLRGDHPLLVVLIGPTGAGKSSIMNALVGERISAPGVVRPCTSHPIAVGPPAVVQKFRDDPFLSPRELEVEWVTRDGAEAWALVDTPDFDSIEPENRRRSETLLRRADRVILVLNPEKYGDRVVWETIELIRPLGSLAACVFNKEERAGARDDCARLLEEHGLPAPLSVPRQTGEIGLDPSVRATLQQVLAPPEGSTSIHDSLRAQVERLERSLRESSITPWITALESSRRQLESGIESWREDLSRRVGERLPLQLDEALRRQLLELFSQQVEKIDILRQPRRWVGDAWNWVRSFVPFTSGPDSERETAAISTAEWMAKAYRDRFEEFVFQRASDLGEQCRAASTAVTPPFPWPEPPTLSTQERHEILLEVFSELEEAIHEESKKIAEGLPMLSKLGFYGSQVAVHAVALVVFIKTAGLTGTELALQGLSSPLLAKAVGALISGGESTALEQRLGQRYVASMADRVAALADPVLAELARVAAEVPGVEAWETACGAWDREDTDAARGA